MGQSNSVRDSSFFGALELIAIVAGCTQIMSPPDLRKEFQAAGRTRNGSISRRNPAGLVALAGPCRRENGTSGINTALWMAGIRPFVFRCFRELCYGV